MRCPAHFSNFEVPVDPEAKAGNSFGTMLLVRTRVAPSAIHGLGLFAIEPIAQGTPIWRLEPGFDQVFSSVKTAALPPPARDHIRWFAFVNGESGDAILSGDNACFMNHANSPNTGVHACTDSPLVTVALRDLAAGEELTCDYFAFDADAARKLGLMHAADGGDSGKDLERGGPSTARGY